MNVNFKISLPGKKALFISSNNNLVKVNFFMYIPSFNLLVTQTQ